MLSALLKKQFSELNAFYFQNRKTGKRRSKGGIIGFAILYIFLFIFLAMAFFSVASTFAMALIPMGLTWLYFSIMAVLAIFLGVFGGVFNTYAGLYHAKDNELLLSMPIPPSKILFSRMVGVYAMGLMYEAIVFIPVVIAYFVFGKPSVLSAVNSVLLILIIGFLVLTLSCFFGFIVAVISGKLKNKSFITVIISLAFFAVYYYFCMNTYSAIQNIITNAEKISITFKNSIYPLYLLGRAAEGDALSMILFTLFTAVLFALAYYILSKTFMKISTKGDNTVKVKYKEKTVKEASVGTALFRKELKHFASSPTYILNCSLGSVFMIAGAAASLIFASRIREAISDMQIPEKYLYLIAVFIILCISSLNTVTAPSISLEGKNIWILQSVPVSTTKIFDAKQYLNWIITMPAAVIFSVCVSILLKADFSTAVFMVCLIISYIMMFSALGLFLDLNKPNLSWTNETVPIKQSMSVGVCVFGGWFVSVAIGALGYLALKYMEPHEFFLIVFVLIIIITRFINRWLKNKGVKIFENL